MAADDDAALLHACREGDPDAWERLVRRYQRLIYAIPRRAGLSEDLAAEVFQRVCVTLLEHIDRIAQPERLSAWLTTTARRESWRQLRNQRVVVSLGDDDGAGIDDLADTTLLPDELVERAEQQHTVRLALGELDERCRDLLHMLFYRSEPPPYTEIAAALNMPAGSIGPTRARCLQKLQRVLAELDA
jgi:RNA polymerase sigma factor (sigma-70 family)